MHILVTGGAGFIGSHVAEAFLVAGARVRVLDDLSFGRRENVPEAAEFVECDVLCPRAAALAGEADVVAHLAAQVDVRSSVTDPVSDARANILGTVNLLQAMGEGARMIFASSAAVYGDAPALPASEDSPKAPRSPYGAGKLAAETYVRAFRRLGRIRATVFRFANVFGPRQEPHGDGGVVAVFARRMLSGLAPRVFGDGLHVRDYIHVEDIARAFVVATEQEADGTFNLGNGRGTTTLDIASWLARAVGPSVPAPEHVPERPGDVRESVLCPERFRARTGWSGSRNVRESMPAVAQWYRTACDAR